MPMSLEELKLAEPRRYCSECDKTKPVSEFPTKTYGLKNRPGKICIECAEKHKLPKIEAEILGISESKPLLKELNTVKEADDMYEDEDEERTKECTVCREFKPLDEFDTSKKICEECVEEMEAIKKRIEKLKAEKEDEEDIKKTCSVCGNDKTLKRFGFDSETNKIKDICKICERIGRVKEDLEPKKIESKYCSKCDTEKPVSEFYMKKGREGTKLSDFMMPCKKCKDAKAKIYRDKRDEKELKKNPVDKNLQAKESTEKRALELLNEYPTFFKRYKITAKILVEKFGFAKSTAANYMKELVNKGLFKEQGRGNGRSWSYIGKDETTSKPLNKTVPVIEEVTMETETNEISKSVKETYEQRHCPKCDETKDYFRFSVGKDICMECEDKIDKAIVMDTPKETKAKVNESCLPGEPKMNDKDIANMLNVNQVMDVNKTQQDRIIDLIDIAYPAAEKIEINPQTHEINIKMKAV